MLEAIWPDYSKRSKAVHRILGGVAQRLEQGSHKPFVAGSSPATATNLHPRFRPLVLLHVPVIVHSSMAITV